MTRLRKLKALNTAQAMPTNNRAQTIEYQPKKRQAFKSAMVLERKKAVVLMEKTTTQADFLTALSLTAASTAKM